MKKILILILIIIITGGCYDYKELNNLAIISGISIDYENNQYEVCFEILNDAGIKENNVENEKTFYVDGNGKTIADAFESANLKLHKVPFFSHIKVMILSKSILNNHSKDIIDYILRNSYTTNMFYVVTSDYSSASSLLKTRSTQNKIVSESIYKLIDNKPLGNSLSLEVNFEDYTNMVVSEMMDLYLPVISVDNNDLKLKGIAIFSDDKLKDILSFNESTTLTILLDESTNSFYKSNCNNDNYVTINIHDQKINSNITSQKLSLRIKLLGTIEENKCNYNLRDSDDNLKLEKEFEDIIKNDIYKLLKKFQSYDSDVLGINYKYYKDTKKTLDFKKLELDVDVDVNINKNGLIFEVANDNK